MINLSKCLIVILVLFSATMVLRRQAVRTDKDRYLIQVEMIKTVFLSHFLLQHCIFLFLRNLIWKFDGKLESNYILDSLKYPHKGLIDKQYECIIPGISLKKTLFRHFCIFVVMAIHFNKKGADQYISPATCSNAFSLHVRCGSMNYSLWLICAWFLSREEYLQFFGNEYALFLICWIQYLNFQLFICDFNSMYTLTPWTYIFTSKLVNE